MFIREFLEKLKAEDISLDIDFCLLHILCCQRVYCKINRVFPNQKINVYKLRKNEKNTEVKASSFFSIDCRAAGLYNV